MLPQKQDNLLYLKRETFVSDIVICLQGSYQQYRQSLQPQTHFASDRKMDLKCKSMSGTIVEVVILITMAFMGYLAGVKSIGQCLGVHSLELQNKLSDQLLMNLFQRLGQYFIQSFSAVIVISNGQQWLFFARILSLMRIYLQKGRQQHFQSKFLSQIIRKIMTSSVILVTAEAVQKTEWRPFKIQSFESMGVATIMQSKIMNKLTKQRKKNK